MTTQDKQVLEKLNKALSLLDHGNHWIKSRIAATGANGRTSYCAVGALRFSFPHSHFEFMSEEDKQVYSQVRMVFLKANNCITYSVQAWNDNCNTTWEDVELAFKKAITYVEERIYNNANI